jgi:hypothetical protein
VYDLETTSDKNYTNILLEEINPKSDIKVSKAAVMDLSHRVHDIDARTTRLEASTQ